MRLQIDMFKLRSSLTLLLLAVVFVMTSCSTVAFTGRRRLLLYDDGQITALSDQSYGEMMAGSSQRVPELYSTHPSDERRIASLKQEIPKVKAFVAGIR